MNLPIVVAIAYTILIPWQLAMFKSLTYKRRFERYEKLGGESPIHAPVLESFKTAWLLVVLCEVAQKTGDWSHWFVSGVGVGMAWVLVGVVKESLKLFSDIVEEEQDG